MVNWVTPSMTTRNVKAIKMILSIGIGALPLSSACASEISLVELAQWHLFGPGKVELLKEEQAVRLVEGRGSSGVVLLSPRVYGKRMVARFKVKPEIHESICVVFTSASAVDGKEIIVPEGYNGNFDFWRGPNVSVKSYTFAFHTGYHQPNAFLIKNPGPVELAKSRDIATDQRWYTVEIGRDDARLWMRIDGKIVLEGTDDPVTGLLGGHFGLRVRGPGDGRAAVLYKDMNITE
jgi:hypothetical protein